MANETQTATPTQTTANNPVATSPVDAKIAPNADKFYKPEATKAATTETPAATTQVNNAKPAETATPAASAAATPAPKDPAKNGSILTDKVATETPAATPEKKAEAAATEPEKKTEEKPAEGSEKKAPEKYDLKLPENSRLDKAAVDEIAAFAKAQGLSNDAAQEIVNREHKAVQSFAEAQVKQVEVRRGQWFNEIKNHPELGGANFHENAVMAEKVVSRFGNKTLRDELSATGLGNHPALFDFTVKVARALNMKPERMVPPNASAEAKQKSTEQKFYGDKK